MTEAETANHLLKDDPEVQLGSSLKATLASMIGPEHIQQVEHLFDAVRVEIYGRLVQHCAEHRHLSPAELLELVEEHLLMELHLHPSQRRRSVREQGAEEESEPSTQTDAILTQHREGCIRQISKLMNDEVAYVRHHATGILAEKLSTKPTGETLS
jgi:hypothetical protein